MNEHTQDVEQLDPIRSVLFKASGGISDMADEEVKALNKAYLSQVLEALGDDDKDVRGTSQNPNNPNYHTKRTKYRNQLRQELRTKFNKLWGKD